MSRNPANEPQSAATDEPPRVAVVRLSGADDGKVTAIISTPIIIGRSASDVTVALPRDQWASRRHARITYHDGQWWIEDMQSANGTSIGAERRLTQGPTPLSVEEVFRVGHTDLMLTTNPADLMENTSEM